MSDRSEHEKAFRSLLVGFGINPDSGDDPVALSHELVEQIHYTFRPTVEDDNYEKDDDDLESQRASTSLRKAQVALETDCPWVS